ncbi:MAG: hypothetical protein AAFX40_03745 [Cyanobacteria bacterium J06639_1]
MGSLFCYREQFVSVSNKRFDTLLQFAIEVGSNRSESHQERQFVENLRIKIDREFWNGYDIHIESEFPNIEERKFWAKCFFDIAHLIFLRKLGNQEVSFWQSSTAGDAYIVARMLTRSVQEEECAWHPETLDSNEAKGYYSKIDVRL